MFKETLEIHRHIAPVRSTHPAGCPAPTEVAIYFTRSTYQRILVLSATANALGVTLSEAYHGCPQFGWRVAESNWDEQGTPVADVKLHVNETHCWISANAPFPLNCELTSEPLALSALRTVFDGPSAERVAIADGWTLARHGEALELSHENGRRVLWEPGEASAKSPMYQVCQALFEKALLERDRAPPHPAIVIYHDRGVIVNVVSNTPAQVVLLDENLDEGDEVNMRHVLGSTRYVKHYGVNDTEVSAGHVERVLEAISGAPTSA